MATRKCIFFAKLCIKTQITLALSSPYIQCILYIFVLNNYTVVAPWLWEHHWSMLAPGRRSRAIFRQFVKARLSCLDSKFSFGRGNRASPGKQNIQDEKTCESKTANLLVLQPSKEGKTRTPMQKAIVNQYSNVIVVTSLASMSKWMTHIKGWVGFLYRLDAGSPFQENKTGRQTCYFNTQQKL